ncbi:MAG: hypothetical protein ACTSWZ_02130 [Candidatus Heimdallarchaeaceae archaeon]
MVKLVEKKKYVCLKCGNTFDSTAKTPRCHLCKSRKVVDYELWLERKQENENNQKEEQKLEFNVVNDAVKPVKLGDDVVLTSEKPVNHPEYNGEKPPMNSETNNKNEKPPRPHNGEELSDEMVKYDEKSELKDIRRSSGISIPSLPISFLVLLGIIALIYWKRKELWNKINFLLRKTKNQTSPLDYSSQLENPILARVRHNLR